MARNLDAALSARLQKDFDGFAEHYAAQLDQIVGDRVNDLRPAWERMRRRSEKRLYDLFADAIREPNGEARTRLIFRAEREAAFYRQLTQDLGLLTAQQQPYFMQALASQVEHSYYFTAFGLEQAARVYAVVPVITPSTVLGVIANPWLPDKLTYSDRIRLNTALVATKTRAAVAEAAERGLSINEAARGLSKEINEGYYNATRLMRTELNRAAAQGASMSYMQNADILDGKRWNATLDGKTAPRDAANDGKVYDLDYDTPARPGVPGQRIPNHPHCRCSWVPVLSALGVSTRERIARGAGTSRDRFGPRAYTQARTYDEYAAELGLPLTADLLAKDSLKRYLRNGETLESVSFAL